MRSQLAFVIAILVSACAEPTPANGPMSSEELARRCADVCARQTSCTGQALPACNSECVSTARDYRADYVAAAFDCILEVECGPANWEACLADAAEAVPVTAAYRDFQDACEAFAASCESEDPPCASAEARKLGDPALTELSDCLAAEAPSCRTQGFCLDRLD